MCARFKGRSLSVINDLNVEEQIFLYQKTRELKEAHKEGRGLDAFRLKNPEASFYLLFMEDSTRTKESFRNAAAFHGGRVNLFDAAASSFNKMESISDTVKMLVGYAPSSTFIIRSRLEGLTAFLDDTLGEYCVHHGIEKPVFINAGDGKHEHPTQELLDEFSFLEQKNWDRSAIHLAIVGDLFHGRTVHSKVNGLRIFDSVRVDLIAPKELMMPEHYIDEMKSNGFSLRIFASIEEYLTQDDTAGIWYFTRLQLERMGVFSPGHALCSYEPLLKPFEVQIPEFKNKENSAEMADILRNLVRRPRYQEDVERSLDIHEKGWAQRSARIWEEWNGMKAAWQAALQTNDVKAGLALRDTRDKLVREQQNLFLDVVAYRSMMLPIQYAIRRVSQEQQDEAMAQDLHFFEAFNQKLESQQQVYWAQYDKMYKLLKDTKMAITDQEESALGRRANAFKA